MKLRIIASALLIVIFAGISNYADAAPWRGGYRGGWFPHPVARAFVPRVFIPPIPIPVPRVVVAPGYYGPAYGPGYGPGYYGGGYYGGRGYYGGHYGHGYYGGGHYGHGYGGGHYGHGGGHRR